MIERLIASPMPMPPGLVVKNGSKSRSAVSGLSPVEIKGQHTYCGIFWGIGIVSLYLPIG